MELRIISREIIKPSSPTPPHLRTHKLSVLDQMAADFCFPIFLFYSGKSEDTIINNTSDRLKNSLSKILTHYYPYAGRVKDAFSVDCDDSGVSFIEACVANEMSEVLNQPREDLLEQLLPGNLREKQNAELAIQVNYFGCGGIAVCALFNHTVADAKSATYFLKNWATIACGSNDVKNVIFDCTSFFPPQDVSIMESIVHEERQRRRSTEAVAKIFTFDGNKIAALREKIGNIGPGSDRPTRFEAVSTLLLGAAIAIARERDEIQVAVIIPVDLRKKMNPQFPPQAFGNIVQPLLLDGRCLMDKTVDYNTLAGKLHESIKMVNDNFIRKLHADGGFVNVLRNALGGSSDKDIEIRWYTISSWCRFPYYEVDFGWGKPIWATTVTKFHNAFFLLDTKDGEGIQVQVTLSKEDMAKFEQVPDIISYTSFNIALN